MRNALAYAGKTQRRIVSAWIGTAFAQDDAAAARKQWREVADQARPRVPKLAALMDEAEADVLALHGLSRPAPRQAPFHGCVGQARSCSVPHFSRLPYCARSVAVPLDVRARPGLGFSDQALTNRV